MKMMVVIIHVDDLEIRNQEVLSCTKENKEFSHNHRPARVLTCSYNISNACFKINF